MIVIDGPAELCGELKVQGAKNSTLPLLAATVLCRGQTVLHNCPHLSDVDTAVRILEHLGSRCHWQGDSLVVDTSMTCFQIPPELMREMRSSIVFLGAIISRCGEAELCFPGGCELGPRPIDLHIDALRRLGVEIEESGGCLRCCAPEGIQGTYISLSFPSVGATENIILASACSRGTTVIANAAREPEISDLAAYLNRCGARIYGAGEGCIIIDGVKELYGCEHTVMPDRIAAATYMAAAAVTGGECHFAGCGQHAHPAHAGPLRAVGLFSEAAGPRAEHYGAPQAFRCAAHPHHALSRVPHRCPACGDGHGCCGAGDQHLCGNHL